MAALYGAITAGRMTRRGIEVGVPVICVGNYTLGGAGKTPTVLALVEMLRGLGETPFVISRGYGGALKGALRVDAARHTAEQVGDEPLMMEADVPVVIARNRIDGAALARANGASVIVMDDGFQNPSLRKDVSVIVIDAARGIGNGRVFPAGPLRAPLSTQLVQTDALMVIGDGDAAASVAADITRRGAPVFRATLMPDSQSLAALRGKHVLAFAGIGDPEKFFATLSRAGLKVAARRAFPDHHVYSSDEIASLRKEAGAGSLTLVTTQKDMARLGTQAGGIASLIVALNVENETAFRAFVSKRLNEARAPSSRRV